MTLYEAENASGLANGQPFPSLGSRGEPAQNADGSTGLYLGPKAPEGKEANWLATVPAGVFRDHQAVWLDRGRHQQELEAWRHRESEVIRFWTMRAASVTRCSGWMVGHSEVIAKQSSQQSRKPASSHSESETLSERSQDKESL